MPGTLILCATPIGNLGDISERLTETLTGCDVIFAEDTRRTGQLLNHVGISKPMRSYFAGNEAARNDEIRALLADDATVAVVSDAGMPVVSDPGKSAVAAAIAADAVVTAVPGPSAPVMAIAVSGFDGDRFVFEGFLPRKGTARGARLEEIAAEQRTVAMFSATKRVGKDLSDLADRAGHNRRVVVARELTKLYEEVWRGTLGEAVTHWGSDVTAKGEFTIVIEGAAPPIPDIDTAVEAVRELMAAGGSASRAVKAVAASHGVPKNDLYEAVAKSER
jgi:16S rRNA (cytidine1402-2'-O)-methyltransferase